MPIRLKCSSCGKVLSLRDEMAGKAVKCPGCKTVLRAAGGAKKSTASAASGQRSPAAKTSGKTAAPAVAPPSSLDELFAEEGFEVKSGSKTCPGCFASVPQDALLCTHCGFNFESGTKVQAHRTELDQEISGEAALKKAEQDMLLAQQMQAKMESGAGMPWWMLSLILFIVVSGVGVAVAAINVAKREDDATQFNALATLLGLSGSAFMLVGVGAQLVLVIGAFKENVKQGALVLLVPFYALYYGITRFSTVGKPMLLSIFAGSVGTGLLIGAMAAQ